MRKLNELNLAATASCNNLNVIDYISVDQTWKQNAMTMSLFAFVETFDPIPKVCAFLRYKNVLTQNEHEKIRSQVSYGMSIFLTIRNKCLSYYFQLQREDRVLEFLSIIQQKDNWFNHLKQALNGDYNKLLDLLQRNYDTIKAGIKIIDYFHYLYL